ncbi:hypothetical protein [Actinomadura rugatobispora]|uniref:Uncharacterized protein n=1 Tax=Actinomadura rugatobispora TaxID=1994 RepID=A0ABW0ZTD5_9ACTN|nr:hypothetical protein GCM10010200_058880 [Actinomadura rugatobispora]
MLEKKRIGLLAVGFVLLVVTLEVLALQLGSLELELPHAPAMAEDPAP